MNKFDYITRQLGRTERKRFEHYVVTRIWHKLNDLTIKFVTQQYVIRPNGRALTDLYFPQLGIHIEVNEAYHLSIEEQDKLRQLDIVNATNHILWTVDTSKGIEDTNNQIDEIVEKILKIKNEKKDFKSWNMDIEQNPQFYIDKGFLKVSDDVAFKNSVHAVNCFGRDYKGFQKGSIIHPTDNNILIWFPKLYKNRDWDNRISDDEETITEKSNYPDAVKGHVDSEIGKKIYTRITFAQVKSPLGDVMYRFKGVYDLDLESTNYTDGLIWRRVSDTVKTFR